MREIITFLACAVPVIGVVPYLINIVKGKTRPNIVTWFTWSLINAINAAAAFSSGAGQTALYSAAGLIATGSIVVLGLKYGKNRYTRFDAACQAVALLGIPLWLATSQPALAILVVMLVDFSGGLPTQVHAWKNPDEETLSTFILSLIGGALLIASLTRFDFVALALPAYIFLFDLVIIWVILHRRKSVSVKRAAATI